MGSAEIKPGEGVRPGSVSRGPSGSSLGFLTDQDQQDSFSACSTAGHAAARDEVLTGHGPGNGSSGAEWDFNFCRKISGCIYQTVSAGKK